MQKNIMKRMRTLLVIMALAAPLAGAESSGPLKAGCRIAIIGDSITEQRLYSNYIESYLLACCPELKAEVFQFGWSGEVAAGFEKRMGNDMAWFKPTLATICFGMNDGRYSRLTPENERQFEGALRNILTAFKQNGTFAVVGGPGAVDTRYFQGRPSDPSVTAEIYNETLSRLSAVASNLAAEAGFKFAGLHQVMMQAMARAKQARGNDYAVCGKDGIHPSPNGHLIMAYAFLKAMGVSGDIGTISMSMKDGRAAATSGHKVLAAACGRVELESTRYPYCFNRRLRSSAAERSADPSDAASMLPFIPFNQELNRLILKVDGLAWEKAKVRWGAQSKVFSKGELETGINLAAEFADGTPFAEAFTKVQQTVAFKQEFETLLVKGWLTKVPAMEKLMNGDARADAGLHGASAQLIGAWASLRAAAAAAAVPVKHSILIEKAE
jgi:lysophospholipase L1-like esterase